jgi:hypothetical protein
MKNSSHMGEDLDNLLGVTDNYLGVNNPMHMDTNIDQGQDFGDKIGKK